jgi:hypothetical protein
VSLRQRLWPYAQLVFRRLGPVRFEDLRRVRPVSRLFGTERGSGIDRRYIDRFLEERRALVRGRVLEVAERRYGPRLGGARAT